MTALGSVVIAAYDEEAVIARCLEHLLDGVADGELDVVVVANGCSDGTAEAARAFPVKVVELVEASKAAALRAGDEAVSGFPRLYLDADVVLPAASARRVLEHLRQPESLAARPPLRYETSGAATVVRRYYRARGQLPSLMCRLWGAGAYALSEQGRARFGEFPDVTADDLFVDQRFDDSEVALVDCAPVVVRTAQTAQDLLKVLRRQNRGKRALAGSGRGPATSTVGEELIALARSGVVGAGDAAVYATLAALSRTRPLGRAVPWERDESTRAGHEISGPAAPSTGATHVLPPAVDLRPGTASQELLLGSVLTVTHNSADDLPALLHSLAGAGLDARAEVLVVDNASADATPNIAASTPGTTLMSTGANLGYSGAINHGRQHRRVEGPLLVVNPDLRLHPQALTHLTAALRDEQVGVAVPRMVDEHGRLFHSLRREPTVRRAIGDALFGRRWADRPAWLSEIVWQDDAYGVRGPVDWATGAALLVRPECDAAVGDWDGERFFLYSEETDFARRARDAGYRVEYVPTAVVTHRGSGSGASSLLVALLVVNRVRYFEKHHGRVHATVFRAVAVLHELLRAWKHEHRVALSYLLRRRTWANLPGGRP